MICPLCGTEAPLDNVDQGDEDVTVEYRCLGYGHIIQFLLPAFLYTLLIINDDGDELYQLHFDVNGNIIEIRDWDGYKTMPIGG